MINLDFEFESDTPPGVTPRILLIIMEESGFFGRTIFEIDDVSFTNRVPVLWLAWQFRRVMQWIEEGAEPFAFYNGDHNYGLKFSKIDGDIEILGPWFGEYASVSKALRVRVKPSELARAFKRHYRRVYKACTKLYPALKTDESLQSWLYCKYQ